MNIRVVIILILTISALAWLSLYIFGSYAKGKTNKSDLTSLDPDTLSVNIDNEKQSLAIYHNKDKQDYFYSIVFPAEWKITSSHPGEYDINYEGVKGYVKLLDVPDNTSLQLYILGQIEPKLKRELKKYKRTDYRDILINGEEGFQLEYEYFVGKERRGAFTDYIFGTDDAVAISFTSEHNIFKKQIPLFKTAIYSFKWESM